MPLAAGPTAPGVSPTVPHVRQDPEVPDEGQGSRQCLAMQRSSGTEPAVLLARGAPRRRELWGEHLETSLGQTGKEEALLHPQGLRGQNKQSGRPGRQPKPARTAFPPSVAWDP